MQAIPTLYFPGLCAEAISFYREVLGAEALFQLTADGASAPRWSEPGSPGKILRAGLRIGDQLVYFSEGHHGGNTVFEGLSMVLHVDSQEDVQRILHALGAGGAIRIPPRETAWADCFGAVVDRFGLHWMVETGKKMPRTSRGTFAEA